MIARLTIIPFFVTLAYDVARVLVMNLGKSHPILLLHECVGFGYEQKLK